MDKNAFPNQSDFKEIPHQSPPTAPVGSDGEPSSSKDSTTNSHETTTKYVGAKRKRFSSRIIKRANIRDNRKVIKKCNSNSIRKRKQLDGNKLLISTITSQNNNNSNSGDKKTRVGDEDNESTSNSENSENGNLFNDINWEENLEIDASDELVEEFAPRPTVGKMISQKIKMESPQFDEEEHGGDDGVEDDQIEEKYNVTAEEQEQSEKQQVLVKVKEEEIKEEDQEGDEQKFDHNPVSLLPQSSTSENNIEQEFTPGLQILVKDYKTTEWNKASILEVDWDEEEVLVHYDARKPDEWVSMSSQRLSRTTKRSRSAICSPKLPDKVDEKTQNKGDVKKRTSAQEVKVKNSEVQQTKQQQQSTTMETTGIRNRKNRASPKFLRYRSNRKNWRFKRQSSLDTVEKYKSKFKIGEKVLAKWSNHRMQKFPAVIKSISGKGAYDLLFYDGFEKTISEEHIYKTTEEEAAKYQDSKPSEADSFVDMDDDSKEARRQRKKKTFDDYVFAKDLKKRSRKVLPTEDGGTSTAGGGAVAAATATAVASTKKALLQTLHTHCRKGRKRKKLLSDEKEDEEDIDAQSPTVNDSTNNDYENSTVGGGTDSDNYHEMLGESEERWIGEIPPDAKPLNIECTDGIRKSVIVPDKVLPLGWTKQCINRTGQMWETFLISPEGYRLNTTKDLKEYSRQILGSRTPRNLDFLVNTKILPELIGKQEQLQPLNNWLPWLGKSGKRKKMKMSAGLMSPLEVQQGNSQQNRIGRVRTLLPKCRTPQVVPTTNEPPVATFSEIWRCPKQGCDKKFRKENLLQMHIKHYHAEFSALVGNAPNVVDLACARSEIVNADRTKSPLPFTAKKLTTKTPSLTPPHNSDGLKSEVDDSSPISNVPAQINTSPQLAKSEPQETSALSNVQPPPQVEERKSTIKTMLPLRQSTTSTVQENITSPRLIGGHIDSEEFDSDDGRQSIEAKSLIGKHGRVLQTQQLPMGSHRGKKFDKKLNSASRANDDLTYPMSPSFKYTRKKLPVLDKLQITTDSNDSFTEEEKVSPNTEATTDEGGPPGSGVVIERLKSEEIINCTCGYREEDGLMIQCDICMCWQHGLCSGVETETDVPERYVCYICRHPAKVRSSKKYSYALHYLSQGKLPSFSFRKKNENEIQQKEMLLKRCYELSANLRQIQNVERSLRAKINIAEQPGHPKLYLWAKNWDEANNVNVKTKEENDKDRISSVENGNSTPGTGTVTADDADGEANKSKEENKLSGVPEPEAPIDLEECRMKLLDHIDSYYQQLDDRLMSLQTQIAALESQDADLSSNVVSDRLMKQTIQMLLRDLKTVQKIAAVST